MNQNDYLYAIVYNDHGEWKVYYTYKRLKYAQKVFPTIANVKLRQFENPTIEPIYKHTYQFVDAYIREKIPHPQWKTK